MIRKQLVDLPEKKKKKNEVDLLLLAIDFEWRGGEEEGGR